MNRNMQMLEAMEKKTEEIINRVAQSQLVSIDLADYYTKGERHFIDIKDQLHMGLLLREKDFREFVATHDWSKYQDGFVAVGCSAEAIVPVWAYMLIATRLQPVAAKIVFGNPGDLEHSLFLDKLSGMDLSGFAGKKIVIKGCGEIAIPPSVFMELTRMLTPVAEKIMYGEPCSTVPVYSKGKMK